MAYDAHVHVDQYPPERRDSLLAEAFAAGVRGIVAVSMNPDSCGETRRLAALWPGRVMPAYGHHPEQPPLAADELERLCDRIRRLAEDAESFAIGEVGLPYYTRTEAEARGEAFDEAPYLAQLDVFASLAAELDRPIALHAVYEDADKALDVLDRRGVRRAHFHWYKGAPGTTARIAARGHFISLTPDVLYEPDIRGLAALFPLGQLMAETDGPWPFEGPFAGTETTPAMTLAVAREIAAIRGMELEAVERTLDLNTAAFYGFG
ncbi:TatD family hydrolase [Cohnella hashimotonis]|uniref:TatD family hydrolase n=1 Tax=Cohnella hashimotonis TaxID=2826895 RepID=A0ABT6THU8_9BACL|nr:TatD family hydrolase [Cohnella hashimotonis]MDI4646304.1 TatD family hydrolase [Cohnella hashimotonis]